VYRTGVRINTLGQIQEHRIDVENKLVSIDGTILKNHKVLKLPIDDKLIVLEHANLEVTTQYLDLDVVELTN